MHHADQQQRNTCESQKSWAARYNLWLLITLMPKGVIFSFQCMPVWCRSPEEHEEYDDDAEEASDSPSVSRRLDSSFANSGARPSQSGQTLDSYFSLCVWVSVCQQWRMAFSIRSDS